MRASGRQHGITLIELLVALAIITIGVMVAVPNMADMSGGRRLAGTAAELQSALQFARTEAIRLNTTVVFCHTNDGSTCAAPGGAVWQGWLIRAAGATLGSENGPVLRWHSWADPQVELRSNSGLATQGHAIRFNSLGMVRAFTSNAPYSAALQACIPASNITPNIYQININSAGLTELVTSTSTSAEGAC
jgi:type IV fimbrial biogenesis protein FimT